MGSFQHGKEVVALIKSDQTAIETPSRQWAGMHVCPEHVSKSASSHSSICIVEIPAHIHLDNLLIQGLPWAHRTRPLWSSSDLAAVQPCSRGYSRVHCSRLGSKLALYFLIFEQPSELLLPFGGTRGRMSKPSYETLHHQAHWASGRQQQAEFPSM